MGSKEEERMPKNRRAPEDVILHVGNQEVRIPSDPRESLPYVRISKNGKDVVYWDAQEWGDDPSVLRSIFNAIAMVAEGVDVQWKLKQALGATISFSGEPSSSVVEHSRRQPIPPMREISDGGIPAGNLRVLEGKKLFKIFAQQWEESDFGLRDDGYFLFETAEVAKKYMDDHLAREKKRNPSGQTPEGYFRPAGSPKEYFVGPKTYAKIKKSKDRYISGDGKTLPPSGSLP